ncbi:hypothetical protein FisN_16Hu005 [Fistulifera solaris]|jgi:hypothetical protein|uniref:Uncharacterized protein n=1 Tax=Fistulifera solaris TaxID=1519565 RepID=A0A1Z5KGS3_FISSO|nr:hypothetical protein FisN_16Hu005 [Fistulifera solaris]|eukprot:GAX25168.1 hypothetical protein FisN_16Hu005 [Fistulifera solaris]
MKLTPIYLQVAAIVITGVMKSYADDTASGLDPTIAPTVTPAPTSTGTNIPTTVQPTLTSSDTVSDIPSLLSSDTISDIPSFLESDEASDVPSTLPTTLTRSDQEDSGGAAMTTGLFGMLLLSMGLF